MKALTSLISIVLIIGLALLLSTDRRAVRLKTATAAFLAQAAIAGLALYFPPGQSFLRAVATAVQHVIDYGNAGSEFLFGDLGKRNGAFIIAFQVLPIIIFFSALMSTLYHLGVMQRVVAVCGGGLHRLLGAGKSESMVAAANIFIGHTEAPLVIKPYLEDLTRSELFAVMTVGMASVAGAVMAGYAAMGIDLDYLITASFMAAPGGLLMAKLIRPETEQPRARMERAWGNAAGRAVNIFDAVGNGALDGLKLAANIGAMLVAFYALIALFNGVTGGIAGLLGYPAVTLQALLGKLLAPAAVLLGVPWDEAATAGRLLGEKFILNEFIAYADMAAIQESLSPRTRVFLTFALCGFANLTSIAILLGGLGSLAPTRRREIAEMGFMAVLAGTLSNLMSAVLAAMFVSW